MTNWINVNDRLPEDEKNVLVCCKNDYGRRYVCEAYHVNHHSVEANIYWNEDADWDYDEEEDKFYVPEGWYEVIHNWDEYGSVGIYGTVTHWMYLPELPMEEQYE